MAAKAMIECKDYWGKDGDYLSPLWFFTEARMVTHLPTWSNTFCPTFEPHRLQRLKVKAFVTFGLFLPKKQSET